MKIFQKEKIINDEPLSFPSNLNFSRKCTLSNLIGKLFLIFFFNTVFPSIFFLYFIKNSSLFNKTSIETENIIPGKIEHVSYVQLSSLKSFFLRFLKLQRSEHGEIKNSPSDHVVFNEQIAIKSILKITEIETTLDF